jgi:hypothetical protein
VEKVIGNASYPVFAVEKVIGNASYPVFAGEKMIFRSNKISHSHSVLVELYKDEHSDDF